LTVCEVTESESMERRLDSLAAENDRLRGLNAALRFDAERLRREAATLGRRFDAACEVADRSKAERDALIEASLTQYSNGRWGAFLGDYALGAFDSRDAAIRELFGCAGLDAEPAERGIDGDA
jgi:hypothetical protein